MNPNKIEEFIKRGQAAQAAVDAIIQTAIDNPDDGLDPVLVLYLLKMGYSDIKVAGPRGVCAVLRQLVTVGVFYGCDEYGVAGRICFDTMQNARLFLKDWDGTTEPTVGEDGCTAIK